MFWEKNFTPSQNIEALLKKENVQLQEFLEEDDILQECKTQKKSIVSYFTRPDIIKSLIELITTEPSSDLPVPTRFRHANMACEILTLGLPSLDEKILSDAEILNTLYSYLENEPPLNPLQSSFFSKTFSMLFTKKAEQDWFLYQQMCLKFLEYIKSQNNFLDLICKHFLTPIIPNLIMQMIRKIEGGQLKRNLYEWLTEEKLVDRLIAILGKPEEKDKHANVAEFLCDLILQGRTMRQIDQENDAFEPVFEGSNPILKTIESASTIQTLLNVILEPNALDSAIISGITVVLTLIKPVVFADEAESDRMKFIQSREKEIHEEILTTVIQTIAPRLKYFNELMHNPPKKTGSLFNSATTAKIPFGNTRLHICRLFTVLLQTNNDEISKSICGTNFLETLLNLFKEYCWNNFLHTEMEKCIQSIFYVPPITNGCTSNSGAYDKSSVNTNNSAFYRFIFSNHIDNKNGERDITENETFESEPFAGSNGVEQEFQVAADEAANKEDAAEVAEKQGANIEQTAQEQIDELEEEQEEEEEEETMQSDDIENTENSAIIPKETDENEKTATLTNNENEDFNSEFAVDETNENPSSDIASLNSFQSNANMSGKITFPSRLQVYAIVDCNIISKLIDCWEYNKKSEASGGRRIGYMGHLIKILKHITNCISEYEHIRALVEKSLQDTAEFTLWQTITQPETGELAKVLATQEKMLANCNAHESNEFPHHLPKDFLGESSTWEYIMSNNVLSTLGVFNESSNDAALQFGRIMDDDFDDDDDESSNNDFLSFFSNKPASLSNPWENSFDSLSNSSNTANNGSNASTSRWPNDLGNAPTTVDNFADFDAHFCRFTNAMDSSLNAALQEQTGAEGDNNRRKIRTLGIPNCSNPESKITIHAAAYDNNANVEKSMTPGVTVTRKDLIGHRNVDILTDNAVDMISNQDEEEDEEEQLTNKLLTMSPCVFRSCGYFSHFDDAGCSKHEDDDEEIDVDDDEGMWIRPFGSSNEAAHTNGPISPPKSEKQQEPEQQPQTADKLADIDTLALNNMDNDTANPAAETATINKIALNNNNNNSANATTTKILNTDAAVNAETAAPTVEAIINDITSDVALQHHMITNTCDGTIASINNTVVATTTDASTIAAIDDVEIDDLATKATT